MVPTMMFLVEISVCYDTPKHSEKHKRNHHNKKAHNTILVVFGVIKFIKICFNKKQVRKLLQFHTRLSQSNNLQDEIFIQILLVTKYLEAVSSFHGFRAILNHSRPLRLFRDPPAFQINIKIMCMCLCVVLIFY